MSGVAESIWVTSPQAPAEAERLGRELGVPAPLAQVLLNRGLEGAAAADRFLHPRLSELGDPFELPDMDAAVARLWEAIDRGEPLAVFGDYDVDGVTATALLVQVIRALGGRVAPFLPRRAEDGYGLSEEALAKCIGRHRPGCIVTVDCGTNAVASVAAARAAGVDVVLTDHHAFAGTRPPAVALVNPHRGAAAPWSDLSGVGVAFKLCHGLVKRGREEGRAEAELDLRKHFDLVALGTVADIVPLRGENRTLVRFGLEALNRRPCAGVRALVGVAGLRDPVQAHHIGFVLGPRLNAAGRLGTAEKALELLLAESEEDAVPLARELDEANRRRREIEKTSFEEACRQVEARGPSGALRGLVAASRGWHPGVVGIVAARLVRRYHRPSVVISIDGASGRGSCRSIEPFNLVEALDACGDLLERHGGHAMAAGLEVRDENIEAFTARFDAVARERLRDGDLVPVQHVDAWMTLPEADGALLTAMQDLRPFGCANPSPVWGVRGVRVVGEPRTVGERHLKLLLADGGRQMDAIAFGQADREVPPGPIDVAAQLELNRYRGREQLQLQVKAFRPAAADGAVRAARPEKGCAGQAPA